MKTVPLKQRWLREFMVWRFFFIVMLFAFPLEAKKEHGLSLIGPLKYEKDFSHFEYVNPEAPQRGTFTYGVVGSFDTLNPFTIKGTPAAGLSHLYASLTFATLLERAHDELFSSYGYVAQALEVAEDKKSITFYLRKEAQFHDGTPIQADDVVYTFYHLKEKGLPFFRQYYKDIAKVTALDAQTVRFDFKDSRNKELKSIVGDMPILSKKFLEKNPLDKMGLTPILGSGPYKIDTFKPGHRITYKRIKNWWGDKVPSFQGWHNFEKIDYVYYRDPDVAFQAFKTGDVDFRIENSASRWATQYTFPAVQRGKVVKDKYHHAMPLPMVGLAFNIRRGKFQDRRVRQALALAFDFEWANKNLFYNTYKRIPTYFVNSDLASTGKPQGKVLELLKTYQDQLPREVLTVDFKLPVNDGSGNIRPALQRAKRLLKEAGYRIQNFQFVHEKTGEPLKFEILLNSNSYEKVLQAFIQNLEILGVKAQLRIVDQAQYLNRVQNYDFDMIVHHVGQSLSPGNEQREMWASHSADQPGTQNVFGLNDPVIDDLVEKIIIAPDRESLRVYCQALDLVLLHGWYMIPFWYDDTFKLAYWTHVKRPEKMPLYHLPLDVFWLNNSKENVQSQPGRM